MHIDLLFCRMNLLFHSLKNLWNFIRFILKLKWQFNESQNFLIYSFHWFFFIIYIYIFFVFFFWELPVECVLIESEWNIPEGRKETRRELEERVNLRPIGIFGYLFIYILFFSFFLPVFWFIGLSKTGTLTWLYTTRILFACLFSSNIHFSEFMPFWFDCVPIQVWWLNLTPSIR